MNLRKTNIGQYIIDRPCVSESLSYKKSKSTADEAKPEPIFIIYRVEQSKLEEAVKRTIEDEIPFLDSYTQQQKMIYHEERASRIMMDCEKPSKVDVIDDCCSPSDKLHYCTARVPDKLVDLDEVVKRTIHDEITYLIQDFANPANF